MMILRADIDLALVGSWFAAPTTRSLPRPWQLPDSVAREEVAAGLCGRSQQAAQRR